MENGTAYRSANQWRTQCHGQLIDADQKANFRRVQTLGFRLNQFHNGEWLVKGDSIIGYLARKKWDHTAESDCRTETDNSQYTKNQPLPLKTWYRFWKCGI